MSRMLAQMWSEKTADLPHADTVRDRHHSEGRAILIVAEIACAMVLMWVGLRAI